MVIEDLLSLTPVMQQYLNLKKAYPDSILLFQMGDFFEMFYEDAKNASKILEIALTSREKNRENPIPMCGVPIHAADSYIERLIKAGFKVAVCVQTENQPTTKGIVRREVVRVITPGTAISAGLLREQENNYLCSISFEHQRSGLAYIDLSTGEFAATQFENSTDYGRIKDELSRIAPKELLIPEGTATNHPTPEFLFQEASYLINYCPAWVYEYAYATQLLLKQFQTKSVDPFGCKELPLATTAAGSILYYLHETQKNSLGHINSLRLYNSHNYMILDATTLRNLEISQGPDGKKESSLLGVIDKTLTAMGARKIKNWLLQPLLDADLIEERLNSVEELKNDFIKLQTLRNHLKEITDIERILSRIVLNTANPRDLSSLRKSCSILPEIKGLLADYVSPGLTKTRNIWDDLDDIRDLLEKAIVEEPPLSAKEGGIIKKGYSQKLDELREITSHGKDWIIELEQSERDRTGINNLRVSYNKVFGYFIEVTKKGLNQIPGDYIRKQTLVGAERFVTPELKEYEEKIINAEEETIRLEAELFRQLSEKLALNSERVQKAAQLVAEIDTLTSLAFVASINNYIKPEILEDPLLEIRNGRHPVVEELAGRRFIPNDTYLDCDKHQIILITGPNMAGKSTYMRQVALIVLMAQMGSFVPAQMAKIGIVDRIFTRVGAQDNIIKGLSTFMVEMNETSHIVHNATHKSLILLDEIGRGTSTFDGIGIAWAVVEHLHGKEGTGAKTLFATHYNELASLARILPGVKNFNVAVKEEHEEIVFLYKILPGAADKSYGIQVAKLAGLPDSLLRRAKEVLRSLEGSRSSRHKRTHPLKEDERVKKYEEKQLSLFSISEVDNLRQAILDLDLDRLTPLEALIKLNELKNLAKEI